jgi:hypothetical protein
MATTSQTPENPQTPPQPPPQVRQQYRPPEGAISVDVADGMTQAAMLTIANRRSNQPANDQALSNLEATSQDTGSGANSEVQQLNLLPAAPFFGIASRRTRTHF